MRTQIITLVRAVLVTLALVLGSTALPTAGAAEAHAPDGASATASTSASPSARRSTERLGTWHCGHWSGSGGTGWRYCAKLTSIKDKFDVDYAADNFNEYYDRSAQWTCKHSKTTTWTFGASVSVKAEAGVIFAKAEASASASVQRSASTTDESSISFTIKPREWAHCKRGMHKYVMHGYSKKQICDSSGCQDDIDFKSFTAHAPSRESYRFGPGRG